MLRVPTTKLHMRRQHVEQIFNTAPAMTPTLRNYCYPSMQAPRLQTWAKNTESGHGMYTSREVVCVLMMVVVRVWPNPCCVVSKSEQLLHLNIAQCLLELDSSKCSTIHNVLSLLLKCFHCSAHAVHNLNNRRLSVDQFSMEAPCVLHFFIQTRKINDRCRFLYRTRRGLVLFALLG